MCFTFVIICVYVCALFGKDSWWSGGGGGGGVEAACAVVGVVKHDGFWLFPQKCFVDNDETKLFATNIR